ncbi:hypothetical protein HK105_204956 [Polyrhizophydium stewartii]|uniref:MobA-like NTP transferase domain-containing protein n=1 Tax=Polyrhizophydium stewartii TaxID=2732419 RepID=A0ABR4N7Y2_9FUNG|nr:hypothetical protein HK105_000610 [Polyrhizophydium stewartii]
MAAPRMPAFNVLFLAAGYGTRLERDIRADATGAHAHLLGVPKALLPVCGEPLLDHWLRLLETTAGASGAAAGPAATGRDLSHVYVVCNAHFHPQFAAWAADRGLPASHVLNDGTASNATRVGAVGDLALAIAHFGLAEAGRPPLLVVAGDTLMLADFDLARFVAAGEAAPGSLVARYTVSADADTLKTGILEIEPDAAAAGSGGGGDGGVARVTGFLEKPAPEDTPSRLACPCFYYLKPDALRLVDTFLHEKRLENAPLEQIDASGKFVQWLIHRHPTYSFAISGRLDIGGLATLIEAEEYMRAHRRA